MVKTAKSFGMTACGLTDHGTVAGAIEFLRECREQEIRPVIGMEGYMCKSHQAKSKEGQPSGRRGNRHINLIAKNLTGFQNICTLSQTASLEGLYYDPRVDPELLYKHRSGVLATSACLSNPINTFLADDKYEAAKKMVGLFQDIYGEDFYLEMMYHGIDREAKILPEIQRLSRDTGVKTIISNDCHYLRKEDAEFHEVVMCLSTNRALKDPKRIKFPYKEFYFKSQEEMAKIFGHVSQYMQNTLEIAEKCDYSDLLFIEDGGAMKLPKFDIPSEFKTPYDYLDYLAREGLVRLGLDKSQPHIDRLNMELSDLKLVWDVNRYDFSTYFLIVQDIMNFARGEGIECGVRGSGFGSLTLKCIGVVESVIDPIEFQLLWERFLGFTQSYFFLPNDFGPIGDVRGN